ncbi:VQ motif-containing protein 8, chloroplastic [Punica granatum]|uniref:VQ domain-containing protein n=2 Tax=Punica granatum TaxID=22663 RepID=A0A218XN26_PUNGR|nr:VQ motif-containing protein 8, chloroplastic [Punica granatum]OWM86314.1 hypothetical protein CDL15_Pgr011138 [Punica granatum]PKI42153.1 hypothetical protein CRG98_037469 [Punica granatum]
MSPAKCHDQESGRMRGINGARPLPLKVSKESHLIHRSPSHSSTSSSTNNSSSSSSSHLVADVSIVSLPDNKPRQKKQPVIIYAHSPKVIHTQASDFMALVQKLTGFSRSDEEEIALSPPKYVGDDDEKSVAHEEKGSPPLPRMSGDSRSNLNVKLLPKIISQVPGPPNSYLKDIPLFTPNSMDLFCSPHRRTYMWPYAGNSISPSVMEFMNGSQSFDYSR